MFPDDEMPGVDYVIPDFSYLRARRDGFRAVVLTHGHEDHIGALSYLLREFDVPVYGTPLTLAIARHRLAEYGLLERARLREYRPGDLIEVGHGAHRAHPGHALDRRWVGLAIETPVGTIVHTGDFKLDPRPVDAEQPDLRAVRGAGRARRRRALLGLDQRRASRAHARRRPRWAPRSAAASPRRRGASSWRRSRRTSTACSRCSTSPRHARAQGGAPRPQHDGQRRGRVRARATCRCPTASSFPWRTWPSSLRHRQVILSTGSQGEPNSALSLIAAGEHKYFEVGPGDLVIFSSRVIPGNERVIGRVINALLRRGAEVLWEDVAFVHVSGHASQDDLEDHAAPHAPALLRARARRVSPPPPARPARRAGRRAAGAHLPVGGRDWASR